jgi:hypothetical protein
MAILLTILACFAGVFAFAFGASGLIGLMNFRPQSGKRGGFLLLLDHLVFGGLVSAFRDIAHNWSKRAAERNLLCIGIACAVVCITLVMLIKRM